MQDRFERLLTRVRPIKYRLTGELRNRPAVITESTGRLDPPQMQHTFVVVVGAQFDQRIPNAMMTCRLGYCNAFEQLGIAYRIVDIGNLERTLDEVNNPFCMTVGCEFSSPSMTRTLVRKLSDIPHAVWVNPWFAGSRRFFKKHDLDGRTWHWPKAQRRRILDSQPKFVFSATTERGLGFFDQWAGHGMNVVSMPLACDTTLYQPQTPLVSEFDDVELAFVGGYWPSKARQIDPYLRPLEKDLTIYGYNAWPYRGYSGQLSREAEPSLYRQSRVCPVVNEPSVAVLHGQINERVFKILGSGGCAVVDAVAAYRDLFTEEELPIPTGPAQFEDMVRHLQANESDRDKLALKGFHAVLQRHTYVHRARNMLERMGIADAPVTDINRSIATAPTARRHCA